MLETGQNILQNCIGNALYGVYYMQDQEGKIRKIKKLKKIKKVLAFFAGMLYNTFCCETTLKNWAIAKW